MLLHALMLGGAAGIASAAHCALMCGPIAALACTSRGRTGERSLPGAVRVSLRPFGLYQLGRAATYGVLGALAGAFGTALQRSLAARFASFALSWSLAVAMGVIAWQLFKATARGASADAVPNEEGLVTLRSKTLPSAAQKVFAALIQKPFFLGMATGFLPCGALFAALLVAASTASVSGGAMAMLAFVGASGLGLAAVGPVSAWITSGFGVDSRRVLAYVLACAAIALALRPLFVSTTCEHCTHHQDATTSAPTPRTEHGT